MENKAIPESIVRLRAALNAENEKSYCELKSRRSFFYIPDDQFVELFKHQAGILLMRRNSREEFVIDADNREVIAQLRSYFAGSSEFQGNIFKGVLLIGPIGVGKTLIMSTFIELSEKLTQKRFLKIHSKGLSKAIREAEGGVDFFANKPMFIDDIGKEPRIVKDFGSDFTPMSDFITSRYDSGAWTLATANYSIETLKEFYGQTISDRIKEMFNLIQLGGNNRRK